MQIMKFYTFMCVVYWWCVYVCIQGVPKIIGILLKTGWYFSKLFLILKIIVPPFYYKKVILIFKNIEFMDEKVRIFRMKLAQILTYLRACNFCYMTSNANVVDIQLIKKQFCKIWWSHSKNPLKCFFLGNYVYNVCVWVGINICSVHCVNIFDLVIRSNTFYSKHKDKGWGFRTSILRWRPGRW